MADIPVPRFLTTPCPECGAEARYAHNWDDDEILVQCQQCGHRFEIAAPLQPTSTHSTSPDA